MTKPERVLEEIRQLGRAISRDAVFVYAGQASFLIVIAAFPFAMLLFSLIQYVLPVGQEELTAELGALLPSVLMKSAREVLDELFARPTVSLISVTAITALWTASRGLNAVKNGLRRMYRTTVNRGLLYNTALSLLYTVLLLALLSVTFILFVFGKRIAQMMLAAYPWTEYVLTLLLHLRTPILASLLTAFFMLVYCTLSGQKLPLRRQFPGAFFAALGWVLFSWGFSLYITNFANYSYVYGGLTAVVLVMVWLYACMTILLIGAEVNAYRMRRRAAHRYRRLLREPKPPAANYPTDTTN